MALKKYIQKGKILTLSAILTFILTSSCKKNEDDSLKTSMDISGFWIVLNESTGNCSGDSETETETYIYSVEQTNGDLEITVYPNEDIIQGQLNGNTVTWSGTLPTTSGNLDVNYSGTVSLSANVVNGEGDWQWYNDSYSCSGTSVISAIKVDVEDADFSGQWTGVYESEENYIDGTFEADISQSGNSLSGTISVSGIGMDNVVLSGKVQGNVVYFGDVDGVIKFVGLIEEEQMAGTYCYNALSDEGSWYANRGSNADIKKLHVTDSFSIETGCEDIAYDGENFYLLSNLEISCIDKMGTTLFKYPAPGNYADGIAYNGQYLLVGDNGWGTNKIYKLTSSGINIMELPSGGDVLGTVAVDSGFWFGSGGFNDFSLYRTTLDGTITHSFSISGRRLHGLAMDEEYIWISYEDTEMFSNTVLGKLDMEGTLLDTFRLEDGLYGRLAYDGENIWLASENLLYAFDNEGNIEETQTIQGMDVFSEITGFTFDGDNFWCATSGNFEEPGKVYCINSESGVQISSFESPGENTVGLAFNGTDLRLADRVTGRLYTIPRNGDYSMPYPSFDITSLCADNEKLYAYNSSDEEMVIFDYSAQEINRFSITLDWSGNFFFDGEYYWSVENFLEDLKQIIKFNSQGNIIAYYQPEEGVQAVTSIVVDGNDIWCVTGDMTAKNNQLIKFQLEE